MLTSLHSNINKVIMHKLRGELSLVKQNIIDYVSTAYFEPKNQMKGDLIQLFCADDRISKKKLHIFAPEDMKKSFRNFCQLAQNQLKSQFLFHKDC